MNRQKTAAFRRFYSFIFFTPLFFTLAAANLVAQNNFAENKLSVENVAAISGKNDNLIKRPRIVSEVKENKTEKKLTESKGNESNSAIFALQLERQVFVLLNEKRVENNLSPLVWSDEMAKIARAHSQEMAQYKFFSHAGRDGSMVDDRADASGFSKWKAIGENIAYNRGYEKPAEFACERWMLSTSHRENVLSARWKEAGIGVAVTPDGTYYFTEVFILR